MSQDKAIRHLEEATKQSAEAKGGEGKEGLRSAPRQPLPLPGEMPVAFVPLSPVRADFRETAAWLPMLHTDAEGKAQASFSLPSSLTSFRLSAA